MNKDNFHEFNASGIVSFNDILKCVWEGKWIIVFITILFSTLSVVYALSLPNIYRSEAIVAPASSKSGIEIPGQLGGLAAIAGVNLSGLGGAKDNTNLALEIIKSREFIRQFIQKNDMLIELMATSNWDMNSNELILDHEIYDPSIKKWTRKVNLPFKPEPSMLEAHEQFMKIFRISKDKNTDMIALSIEHYSPYTAKRWLMQLIHEINAEMRTRDIKDATASIEYLQEQLNKTNVTGIQSALYSLIEEQTKTLMLANVKQEYVFVVIDPPVSPETRVSPRRALIAIFGFIIGLMLSLLCLAFLNNFKRLK